MTRAPGSSSGDEKEQGLKKGPWTPDEDHKLVAYIQKHGHGSWRSLPANAGLQRCGKSCRLRWTNYLRPDIKRGRFSQEEDKMIVHLHALLGNRWSAIASHLPRRTDNEIKNYWNTHLKKRLLQLGIDPITHKSTTAEELVLDSILPGLRPVVSSTLSHMSQWDCARAEAEARLSRQSSLNSSSNLQPSTFTMCAKTPTQGASTSFMSSWKAQVEETLRPSFGLVELDKTPASTPVNFGSFLHDWESSLYSAPLRPFSAYGSPIDVPDLSSSAASEAVSPQYNTSCEGISHHVLPSSIEITERLLASGCSEFNFPLPRTDLDRRVLCSQPPLDSFSFGDCNQFSPTSTLRVAEHDSSSYSSSPCCSSSSNGAECFNLLATQTFNPLGAINFPQGASFWSREQVAMVDALQPEPGFFLPDLEVAVPMMPSNVPIPHFESLC